MNPEPSEETSAFYGQVLAGLQTIVEQQTHAFHALETRLSTSEPRKESDGSWPKFAAESNENVRHWLHQMEFAFMVYSTPGDRKVARAAVCLKGEALSWLISLVTEDGKVPFGNWNDFKRSILERFEPVHLQYLLRDQLRELKQTTTVREYAGRFRSLLNQVNCMAEEDKVTYFVDGLKPDVRFEIERQRPVNLTATITLAEDIHAALARRGPAAVSVRTVASYAQQPMPEPTAMEIDVLESRRRYPGSQRPIRCFNCRGLGHLSRDCPSPRRTNERDRLLTPRSKTARVNALETEPGKEERW